MNKRLPPRRNAATMRQRGVALITVLLVVALISLMAVEMSERLRRQLQRATALAALDEAKWVNIGAEGFASKVLKQDFEDSPERTHLNQYWAVGSTSFPLESGAVFSGELKDMRSCFNLNGVRTQEAEQAELQQTGERPLAAKQFIALLEAVEIDSYQAEVMADSLVDWLDEDDYVNHSSGAEDSEYQSRTRPYLAANSMLVDVGELRAINGFTQEAVFQISPYVCVVPSSNKALLNVNTVQHPELFVAVFTPNMSLQQAEQLMADRPSDGYEAIDDLLASTALAGIDIADLVKNNLTVVSDAFLLKASTQLADGTRLQSEALLKQDTNNWVAYSRRFGGRVERVLDSEVDEPF
ncbi:type II secretion system minor pseudopilin GspK [Neiella marina]|uniref:Type II secretion system protein K n=1 Tax=Neiella holothuriorum TaxID=2870530 RepID=A0ABS7EG25_9GAMM|nr:type II secretion system minor pseudopilin GspK [Neiella holothuriorum]MBW8191263.1 type II secretion system minor pseudopilin GspK [Neiella holothuriorum]